MKIYVGRWDLLPKNWDGINTVYACTEGQLESELNRELDVAEENGIDDRYVGIYEPTEFEDTFNQTLNNHLSSDDYWVKIFAD